MRAVVAGWYVDQSYLAWMAVGEYAREYGLHVPAGECFLSAASRAGDDKALSSRLCAFAGLLLSDKDPDRARPLLVDTSTVPETQLLAAIGLAQLEHRDSSDPIPVPPAVIADPQAAAKEPTVQWFLAEQRLRTGDWDAAVDHHRQALAYAPDSAQQHVALAMALLRRAGAGLITSINDYQEAATVAEAARAEYRRWRGDSARAAHILMQARILAADDASAFAVAIAAPDGEATVEEARAPQLAYTAARLAYGRGDLARGDEFGLAVEASGDPIWRTHLAAARADATGKDRDQRERAWRAVLAVDGDVSRRLVVCAHLAGMGCWPVPELDELRAAGLLTAATYEVQHARALATIGKTAQAVTLLRGTRNNSPIAAEANALLLASLGRVDECVRACDEASARFGGTLLELLALDVLSRADRNDDVVIRCTDLLGRGDLPYRLRHHLRAKLITEHTRRQAWDTCEQLAQRGLREISQLQVDLRDGRRDPLTTPISAVADLAELRREYAWMTIAQQINQGHTDRAYETLNTLEPDIQTAVEITIWFDLHQIHGWTTETAEIAMDLADRPDLAPDQVGKMLLTLMHAVPSAGSPGLRDVHERASRAWQAHIQDHPSPSIQQISATPAQIVERARAALTTNTAAYAPVGQAIRRGEMPAGAASTATSRPYLLGLTQRTAGLLLATAADPQINLIEAQAALDAVDGAVSVETSALYVAAGLLDLWHALEPQFAELRLAAPALDDILLSQIQARGLTNVAGSLRFEPGSGQIWFAELTDAARAAVVNQCTAAHRAAQTCRAVPIDNLDILGGELPIGAFGAWLAPLALAVAQQMPLYSDDIALRTMARASGIPAFGTLALLDALIQAERWQPTTPDPIPRTLFDHHIVDLPQAVQLVLATADQQGPLTTPILLNLARPAIWQQHVNQAIDLVNHLVSQVPDGDAHGLASIVTACTAGWAAAFIPADDVIARVAAIVLAYHTGVTADGARIVVPAIQTTAAEYGVDPLPTLRQHLAGVLRDPDDRFQMTDEQAARTIDDALAEFA